MFRCCICIEDLKNDMNECELQPDLNHISCIPNLTSANYITKKNTDSQGSLTMSSLRVLALSGSSLKVLSMSLSHKVLSQGCFCFSLSQNNDCKFSPAQAAFCTSSKTSPNNHLVKEKYMLSISKHELSQLMCVKGCLTYVSRDARLEQKTHS